MYPRIFWANRRVPMSWWYWEVRYWSLDIHQVTSKELKNLFLSLKVEIPDDPTKKSFTFTLLEEGHVNDLVSEINSLSRGIILTDCIKEDTEVVEPGAVCVFETDFGKTAEEIEVYKESWEQEIFQSRNDNITNVILINTESVGVIDGKLKVYKKYRDVIDTRNIFLQHVYEDFDEMAKLIAYKKVSVCCDFAIGMTRALGSVTRQRLQTVIKQSIDATLTIDNITEICCNEHVPPAGSVLSKQYKCYLTPTIQEIKDHLVKQTFETIIKSLGTKICHELVLQMETVVQSELSKELGGLRFEISKDVFREIENIIVIMIFDRLDNLYGWVRSIAEFFITIFYPVDVNSLEWRTKVADEIYQKILERKQSISDFTCKEILNVCEKTVNNLTVIRTTLENFRGKVVPIDQKHLIKDWLKRDVVNDIKEIAKHPTILKHLAGHRGDGELVVKVFLRKDDSKAEKAFEKACSSSTNRIVFENIAKLSEDKQQIADKIRACEKNNKNNAIGREDTKKLKKIIQNNRKRMFAEFSNITGIRIGKVRCVDGEILNEPCIVLYCLDKTLIPFGERPLPNSLEGWPCDIREDYFLLGTCPNDCQYMDWNFPKPGCSIGMPSQNFSGSVGFLYESRNKAKRFGSGFLTASHVAIPCCQELYIAKKCLSHHPLRINRHLIVHPSWPDNNSQNNQVGEVVESFIGNFGSSGSGLDIAVVENNIYRRGEKRKLHVVKEDDLSFDENIEVTKTGRTTGITNGDLIDYSMSAKIYKTPFSDVFFSFDDLYVVQNQSKDKVFFEGGDSGSGVFLKKQNQPLGIAIGKSETSPLTLVCKIDKILDKLDLDLVHYHG